MATSAVNSQGNLFSNEAARIQTVSQSGLTWTNIETPTSREIDYLQRQYHFHALELEDCLSRSLRPKINEYEDYIFIVLHLPRFHKDTRTMTASQVGIFVGSDFVVTVHAGELKPLITLFRECSLDHDICYAHMKRGAGFLLYSIIDELVDYCFPILGKINEDLETRENGVFKQPSLTSVRETLLLRRNITSLRRIIRPQIAILGSLEKKQWRFLTKETAEDLHIYFGNIGDHVNEIWDMLEEYHEVSDTLSDTSNWLQQHHLQEVMRIMTIGGTIISPLLIVSSIYGMNVPLPLGKHPWGFPVLLLIMTVLLIALVRLIRKYHWM